MRKLTISCPIPDTLTGEYLDNAIKQAVHLAAYALNAGNELQLASEGDLTIDDIEAAATTEVVNV